MILVARYLGAKKRLPKSQIEHYHIMVVFMWECLVPALHHQIRRTIVMYVTYVALLS